MHIIDFSKLSLRTDLVLDSSIKSEELYNKDGVVLKRTIKDKNKYSSISFIDITDKDQSKLVEKLMIKELKEYIQNKMNKILVIGLGNRNSTPDALGPKSIDQILVTRHLFNLGDVEEGYSNVAIFEPNVYGTTGIDSVELIKEVVKLVNPDYVIIIDSLCTSSTSRMNKTIQITDAGINPGSGVLNDRGELSSRVLGCKTIALGVPTVVDIYAVIIDLLKKYNITEIEDYDNLIVTPKEIDYVIEKLAVTIGTAINKALHESFLSTK